MRTLPQNDVLLLNALAETPEPITIVRLAELIGLDQAKVSAMCLSLSRTDGRAAAQIVIDETVHSEYRLGPKGKALAENGFPERAVITGLKAIGGRCEVRALADHAGIEKKEAGASLRWLKQKKWASQQGSDICLEAAGLQASADGPGPDELLVDRLSRSSNASEMMLRGEGIQIDDALVLLEGRKGVLDIRERTTRRVSLSDYGHKVVADGIQAQQEINQLTSEMLRSGSWRDLKVRPYDVQAAVQSIYPGREHPLVSVFLQTRRVFLEFGFSEISSPYVESSFWDFDALFQPQDHPARDMQDTFYVERPSCSRLPEDALVERVAKTHENGGESASIGWRYRWNRELAERPVLRTHTTAATVRAIHQNPRPPQRLFVVGPVFRRETADYKHLPVFHQVDGIIIDAKASFANLLGTLRAFYRKMGFDRFQFRPAFFPYTEPSVEIFVWSERKGDWVEMGGAGMFRPEVREPLGCTAPVLAWGLGLERLAMFRYELASISELYRARMPWLKETPLCRL